MAPDRIRLIDLKTQTVDWHEVDTLSWNKVWTISHIWDRGDVSIKLPVKGVSWKSNSYSSELRFDLMFEKTREIIEEHGAEYVWIDAACIHQGTSEEEELERKEQIPLMGTIYGRSAGCVAFGKQTPEDRFVEIVSTYDDGRKAWVCSWFERVWTFQELQLPKVLFFVSGDHVLTRDEVYLSILMMSPYLTSPHRLPLSGSFPNDTYILTQDVVNALSPLSKSNTQRSLMQTSKRGCSADYINDKVYGILGVLPGPLSKLHVDYKISLAQAVLNLMTLMPPKDVLDTLTFNTLPPAHDIHDAVHWSGMIRLHAHTEHPSYEKDVYDPAMEARVIVTGNPPRATTHIPHASLWKVVVTEPEDTHMDFAEAHVRAWPSIASLSKHAQLTGSFFKVKRSADYAHAIGRAERSLAANWTLLRPLLDKAARGGFGGKALFSMLEDPPIKAESSGVPPNRLGDARLFGQTVTVLVCRSKEDKSFHYGIVVTPNEDGSWHKVCTAAFSNSCVVATRTEDLVVIGK